MYGVVEIAGHQYRVQAGDIIDVEKLSAEPNTNIVIENVYFIGGEIQVVGLPIVKGAKVTAKVIKHDKSRKVLVYKRKSGAYDKMMGHRQQYTSLLITEINDGSGKVVTIDAESKNAKKYLK